jgi:hypothetical protein
VAPSRLWVVLTLGVLSAFLLLGISLLVGLGSVGSPWLVALAFATFAAVPLELVILGLISVGAWPMRGQLAGVPPV